MSRKKTAIVVPAVVSVDPSQLSYNLKQLGVVLGLTEWQCRTLIWEGKIPALKVGRNLLVRRADAEAYLQGAATLRPCGAEWLRKRQRSAA